jgi:hypothetical protein
MGYGIGTHSVDVGIRISKQTLDGFAREIGSVVAKLLLSGCRTFKIDVHERGAVVTGDKPVPPAEATPADWRRKVSEVVRARS